MARLEGPSGEEGGDRDRAEAWAGGVGAAEWVDDILANWWLLMMGLRLVSSCLAELSMRGRGRRAARPTKSRSWPQPRPRSVRWPAGSGAHAR